MSADIRCAGCLHIGWPSGASAMSQTIRYHFAMFPGKGASMKETWQLQPIIKHWHTSAERMVLLSGQLRVNCQGQPPVALHPFMYACGPAKLPHDAICVGLDEECLLFNAFEEPVNAITCLFSRPIRRMPAGTSPDA